VLCQAIISGREAIEKWRYLLFYRYKAVVQLLLKKGTNVVVKDKIDG
jgi:hypothetical protein